MCSQATSRAPAAPPRGQAHPCHHGSPSDPEHPLTPSHRCPSPTPHASVTPYPGPPTASAGPSEGPTAVGEDPLLLLYRAKHPPNEPEGLGLEQQGERASEKSPWRQQVQQAVGCTWSRDKDGGLRGVGWRGQWQAPTTQGGGWAPCSAGSSRSIPLYQLTAAAWPHAHAMSPMARDPAVVSDHPTHRRGESHSSPSNYGPASGQTERGRRDVPSLLGPGQERQHSVPPALILGNGHAP